MFPRALLEIAVANPSLLPRVVVPLGAMTGIGIPIAGVVYRQSTRERWSKRISRTRFDPTGAVFRRGSSRSSFWSLAVRQPLVRRFGDLRDGVPLGLADVDAITPHAERSKRTAKYPLGRDDRYRHRCDREHAS